MCWQNEENPTFDLGMAPNMPAIALAYPMKYAETIAWDYSQRLGISIILIQDDDSIAGYPFYDNLLNYSLPTIS